MNELLYTVAVTFSNPEMIEPWLRWLRQGHIAEVLAGGATHAEIVAMDAPAHGYEVRYRFPSRAALAKYEQDHAPRLRAEAVKLFPPEKGVTYRRSTGTSVVEFAQA